MEKAAAYKRKHYFINKGFQTKFILRFCGITALAGILTIAVIYYLAMRSTTVAIINSHVVVKTTAEFMLPVLVQTVVIVTIFTAIATILVTLYVSHKLVGPLYRFKQVVEQISEGDFSKDFSIRRGDQLQDLAGALNDMIRKVREELKLVKIVVPAFKQKLSDISDHEISENKRSVLGELKKASEELDRVIRFFKA